MYTHGKDKAEVKKKGHKTTGVNQRQEVQECRTGRKVGVGGFKLKVEGEGFFEAGVSSTAVLS